MRERMNLQEIASRTKIVMDRIAPRLKHEQIESPYTSFYLEDVSELIDLFENMALVAQEKDREVTRLRSSLEHIAQVHSENCGLEPGEAAMWHACEVAKKALDGALDPVAESHRG